jgi:hypothetical protein
MRLHGGLDILINPVLGELIGKEIRKTIRDNPLLFCQNHNIRGEMIPIYGIIRPKAIRDIYDWNPFQIPQGIMPFVELSFGRILFVLDQNQKYARTLAQEATTPSARFDESCLEKLTADNTVAQTIAKYYSNTESIMDYGLWLCSAIDRQALIEYNSRADTPAADLVLKSLPAGNQYPFIVTKYKVALPEEQKEPKRFCQARSDILLN